MNEHAMTQGVIPVRHPSLPGVVKLPQRYEKAARGDSRIARHRKVSICSEPARMRQTISDRLDDLMTAIMWVKQELILLRQHDILLKRQFFNINDSIQSLHARRAQLAKSFTSNSSSSTSPSSPPAKSPVSNVDFTIDQPSACQGRLYHTSEPTTGVDSNTATTSSTSFRPQQTSTSSTPPSPARIRTLLALGRLYSASSDIQLQTFHIRASSSASVLSSRRDGGCWGEDNRGGSCRDDNGEDDSAEDTDGDDIFDEHYFRPRTSSMRTSRDLAALARRRGSKELNQLL